MPSISCSQGEVRLYVAIDHSVIYEDIYYIPFMELSYTAKEYKDCCDTREALIENLSAHYLNSQMLSRGLDEYFH